MHALSQIVISPHSNALVKQIISSVSAKTPVVVVLLNGRPLSINLVQDKVPAILEAWHLSISKLLVLSYPTLPYPTLPYPIRYLLSWKRGSRGNMGVPQ